ncbi:3-deoxy-manno-octulosonate cytidylyltransferase [Phenylobacterium deserti]|uniref:3-deoxy-manno-octulosonate cytidylyltransferase n=1 Tax=Phenylobacterium deserti TaxID=1914756 RepID=A0A328ARW7_9CAUL|nr:3-deoxy-manno-octulosonate cytidylyltransferase [Phenylobacterium deserti]RAK57793.1 3-deoxy-manno-octulosonate cytidylyltransferase [Phenylobacterium deserti]
MNPIILIPARMAATRLPSKPLADIGGIPMIVRVLRQAQAANAGPVAVAAGDPEIAQAIEANGGTAVLTDPDLPSGSDRILAALAKLDPAGAHDVVINLQGDMPFVDPSVVAACAGLLSREPSCDIATVVAPEGSPGDRANPDVVKAVLALQPDGQSGRALYFTRSTLYGDAPVWRHIGIYGYRRAALEAFNAAPPSPLERREKLEQLRAMELGLSIWAAVAAEAPISVDNPADLDAARAQATTIGTAS